MDNDTAPLMLTQESFGLFWNALVSKRKARKLQIDSASAWQELLMRGDKATFLNNAGEDRGAAGKARAGVHGNKGKGGKDKASKGKAATDNAVKDKGAKRKARESSSPVSAGAAAGGSAEAQGKVGAARKTASKRAASKGAKGSVKRAKGGATTRRKAVKRARP